MEGVQKRVYSQWAFQDDWEKKRDMNMSIYKELREKYKISFDLMPEQEKEFDVVIRFLDYGYANKKYEICKNKQNLSMDELALICDGGNLCFGYRTEGKYIVVYTD